MGILGGNLGACWRNILGYGEGHFKGFIGAFYGGVFVNFEGTGGTFGGHFGDFLGHLLGVLGYFGLFLCIFCLKGVLLYTFHCHKLLNK